MTEASVSRSGRRRVSILATVGLCAGLLVGPVASALPAGAAASEPVLVTADAYAVVSALGQVKTSGMAHLGNGRLGRGRAAVVDIAVTPSAKGYVLVDSMGLIESFGDAPKLLMPRPASAPVAVEVTPSGRGLWVALRNGGVVTLGDAPTVGPAPPSSSPAVGIAVSPTGRGLSIVRGDGSVAALGDAADLGSAPASTSRVVGIAATPTGNGAWVARSNGTIVALGDATSTHGARRFGWPPVTAIGSLGTVDRWVLADFVGGIEFTGQTRTQTGQVLAVGIGTAAASSPIAASQPGVPGTTKVVLPGAVLATTGDPETSLGVVVTGAVVNGARAVVVGDVIAVGAGEHSPQGLLRRVLAITPNPDGSVTLTSEPATLAEAMPEGAFNATDNLDEVDFGAVVPQPLDDQGRVVPAGTNAPAFSAQAQESQRGTAAATGIPVGTVADVGNSALECGPNDDNEVSATPAYSFNPSLIFSARWGDDIHVELGASLTGNVQVDFEAKGGVSCAAKFALIDDRSLGTKVIFIGSFPVVITPRLSIEAELKGAVNGQVSAKAGVVATVEAKVVADQPENGTLSVVPSASSTVTASPEPTVAFDASAELSLELTVPKLVFVIYGLVAPEAAVVGGLSAGLSPCQVPNLKVEASLGGAFAIKPVRWLAERLGEDVALSGEITVPGSPWLLKQVDHVPLPVNPCTEIQPATLPAGEVGTAYNAQLTMDQVGAPVPATFAVTAGALPPGVVLAPDGTISGTPTAGGNHAFTVTATSNVGNPTRDYTITIVNSTLVVTTEILPVGAVDVAYSFVLAANKLPAELVWSIVGGALPPGITFDPDGTLSGTPTEAGAFNVTVRATHAATSQTAEKVLALQVQAGALLTLGSGSRSVLDTVDVTPDGGVAMLFTNGANVTLRSYASDGTAQAVIDVSDGCVREVEGTPLLCSVDRHDDGGLVVAGERARGTDFELVVRRYDAAGGLVWERTHFQSLPPSENPADELLTGWEPGGVTFAPDGSVAVFGGWGDHGQRTVCGERHAVFGKFVVEYTAQGMPRRVVADPLTPSCTSPTSDSGGVYFMAARADNTFVGLAYSGEFTSIDGGTRSDSETLVYDNGSYSSLFAGVQTCTQTCSGSVAPAPGGIAVAGGRIYGSFGCQVALGEIVGSSLRTLESSDPCHNPIDSNWPQYTVEGNALASDSLVTVRYAPARLPFPSFAISVQGGVIERRGDDGSILVNALGQPISRDFAPDFVLTAFPAIGGQVFAITSPGNPGLEPATWSRRALAPDLTDP